MSEFDHFDLDGRLLNLLVAVHEEGSVTRAAARLGVTQSAVSHLLDKLRGIVGDPLFVKSGRSVVATAEADRLVGEARRLLEQLHAFSCKTRFTPASLDRTLTIAANDLQRDLLLPRLYARLRQEAPQLRLRVIPSNVPQADLLRSEQCLLAISPRPPAASDILQRRLFSDRYAVFYDPQQRAAPANLSDYLAADHITVVYEPKRALDIDEYLSSRGLHRRFVVSVAGFGAIRAFLEGSHCLATLPSCVSQTQLEGLSRCEVPFQCPEMPMYALWHQRHQADPMMRWVLDHLFQINLERSPTAPTP